MQDQAEAPEPRKVQLSARINIDVGTLIGERVAKHLTASHNDKEQDNGGK